MSRPPARLRLMPSRAHRSPRTAVLKLAEFDYDKLTIDGSRELFQKYEIYVDTVLNASDEILEISPTEPWRTSLRIQLLPHRDYLLSPHFKQSGYLDQYGTKLRSFLGEI